MVQRDISPNYNLEKLASKKKKKKKRKTRLKIQQLLV